MSQPATTTRSSAQRPSSAPPPAPRRAGSHTLTTWTPEEPSFWTTQGKRIAQRNLWISVPALLLAFAVWMVWSVVVVNLPAIGFEFTTGQLFWLTAIPGLAGATLRIFYSFLVPIFGGRNFTVLSTASLLLPLAGIAWAVQDTSLPYGVFVVLAALAGFGGGNFASSMSNISFFFPKSRKGLALGINAGLGNLGVSVVQFTVPLVIGASVFGAIGGTPQTAVKEGVASQLWLQNAALVWIPVVVLVVIAAYFGMNNLETARSSFRDQSIIFKRKHTWLMSWLYIGTFGSFIGYSAAFPMLIKTQFPEVNPLQYAFLGPLVGALIRPVGGWLSDKIGGAKVTFWNFMLMIVGVIGVLYFLDNKADAGAFTGFLASFLVLFFATGIGNGSTFRMIPVIFRTERLRDVAGHDEAAAADAVRQGEKESAAVLGFSSAIGAYGAFIIPQAYSLSIGATGGVQAALYGFIGFYASCVLMTWYYYSRRNAPVPC
ncbi:MAG TPA: NarK family nitrate/nitrite MFS transporter [Candidatus Kapabacteria bacterium]|nr:NarK family nitrate/nitrite MFS transporter [Candidatus Kapabacteria bacterium]